MRGRDRASTVIRNIVYLRVTDKDLIWVGSSRADLSALPEDARRQLGFILRDVQRGRAPRD